MKIDRLISITVILLERQKVSIPELAQQCEVSTQTISRDLEAINQAGIPIIFYLGLHGAWASWRTTSWKNGCFPPPT